MGVDPAVIEKYNVVSAPVAAQMALGAAKASGADIAVSVTGVAGPTGGDEVRPVGTVYLGAARDLSLIHIVKWKKCTCAKYHPEGSHTEG